MPSAKIAREDECDITVQSAWKEQGHQRHSPDWRREGLWEMVDKARQIVKCSEGLQTMDGMRLPIHSGVGDPFLSAPAPVLLKQEPLPRLRQVPRLDAIEIHAAGDTADIPLDDVRSRLFHLVDQRRNLTTEPWRC